MKNNEILISLRLQKTSGNSEKTNTMFFLVKKDITLKSLIEGLYYGLKKKMKINGKEKSSEDELSAEESFLFFEKYIKTHRSVPVLYTIMGNFRNVNISEVKPDPLDKDHTVKPVYDFPLSSLGIVTSSMILITDREEFEVPVLFDEAGRSKTYILRDNNTLEYNISTRRLNVIEPAKIDILPAGDIPADSKQSVFDVLIPPLISAAGMIGIKIVVKKLTGNSALNNSMMAMTVAMPLVSAVNSAYSYKRQGKKYVHSVADWKEKYENYISRMITRIVKWQRDEIIYLNKVYPSMDTLFAQTAQISPAIFARSQNDNDFMKITLGQSDEIKPLFEISSEKKDDIFYDVYYRLVSPKSEEDDMNNGLPFIKVYIPEKKKKKKKVKEVQTDTKNRFLLTELPYNFANTQETGGEQTGFKFLRDYYDPDNRPPLLIDLRTVGTLGVISKDENASLKFVKHLAFELSYYHSPEDLQMVFFFNKENIPEKQKELTEDYMFLPHTNELFEDMSQFVFSKDSAGEVFSRLQTIMAERDKENNSEDDEKADAEKLTQIVCFVMCDYDIKETAFSKYIPEAPKEGEEYKNTLGLTFVFITREKGLLPKYCGSIVEFDDTKRRISSRYNLLSHETLSKLAEKSDSSASTDDIIEYTNFTNDFIFGNGSKMHTVDDYSQAYRRLSSIYYTRIAENGKVPSVVTLFEMYREIYRLDADEVQGDALKDVIRSNWLDNEKNNVTKNLKVAMGKNEHGITYLDLHENYDGPHMLVAGTTGSGKSETIITYLIGLCVRFSPMDLNLMLVDMKGGGFSDRLGDLPHCVGTVTNTAGESEGISAVYMLKRFLSSLNAEIKKREIILSELGVDNTDAYMRVLRKIKRIHELAGDPDKNTEREELIKGIRDGNNPKQIRYIDGDISELKPLSHLILVVDEFTELKRFSSESNDVDFIAEITTIARVGRTLGLHIILVSQNIEGAINDDIRVNTKSKICLKVATKQASKEMLGTADAAAATMPGHGRAYILVGTGSRYEYFQSAYTGANQNTAIEPSVSITSVTSDGAFDTSFYVSDHDNEVIRKRKKLVNSENTQLKCIVSKIIELADEKDDNFENRFEIPEKIFRMPLPQIVKEDDSPDAWNGVNEE